MNDNPLLQPWVLPPYDAIRPEHVVPAITHVLEANLRQLAGFLPGQLAHPTFAGLMQPLEDMHQRLLNVEQTIYRLANDADEAFAEQYQQCNERLQSYQLALRHNNSLHGALLRLQQVSAADLDPTQRAALELALRDARLAGVGFDAALQRRQLQIEHHLDLQYRQYGYNLTQAQGAWTRHVSDASALAGASPAMLFTLAENARLQGRDGWLITLEFPQVQALLQQLHNRQLREEIYRAWHLQASTPPWDNAPVVREVLRLRSELATLSGHAHYASRAMVTRMFDSHEEVESFLLELIAQIRPVAIEELGELTELAEWVGAPPLQPWDLDYYQEKYCQAHYGFTDRALRQFFPLTQVLEGVQALTLRLFHVELLPRPDVPVWHSDVLVYELVEGGESLGHLYFDLLARADKRPGAWMEALCDRHRFADGRLQLPAALLSCELLGGSEPYPTSLGLRELKSLLHEFGHGLQHVLTRVDYGSVAGGKGLAEDAIEFTSTLFEQWALLPDSLVLFSGASNSAAVSQAVTAESRFSAMDFLQQLQLALLDYRLHARSDAFDPAELAQAVLAPVEVLGTPAYVQHIQRFAHLFSSDEYAGGYYTYVWSRVLAEHLFQRFRREGMLSAEAGMQLRELILAPGGTRPVADLIESFTRSRPDSQALLQTFGIATPVR